MSGTDLKGSWVKTSFQPEEFVKLLGTTGKVELLAGTVEEAEFKFAHRIVNLVEKHNIPQRETQYPTKRNTISHKE